jgi:hypothetical protein
MDSFFNFYGNCRFIEVSHYDYLYDECIKKVYENHESAMSFKAKQITPFSCPFIVLISSPFSTPQSLRVASVLHDIR